jgi:hypothetical protein
VSSINYFSVDGGQSVGMKPASGSLTNQDDILNKITYLAIQKHQIYDKGMAGTDS